MNRPLVIAVACFLTPPLHAQFVPDTAFVRFSGDTVKICHINFTENCAAQNISTAEIRSDTVYVVESDTGLASAKCVCLYDFTTSLVGLEAGNYVAVISTVSRRAHWPMLDTTRTRWMLPFRVIQGPRGIAVNSSVTPCHGGHATPAWTPVLFPLQPGTVWEYTEDLSFKYQVSVERDTLMPNGRKYAVVASGQWLWGYTRQEGDSVFQYAPADSGEQLIYDFSRLPGDTVYNRIRSPYDTTTLVLTATGTMNLYGRNLRYWTFYRDTHPGVDDEQSTTIVDSIGLYELRPSFGPWDILSGAKIDGTVYGIIDAVNSQQQLPTGFALLGNYPNPFNPKTGVRFQVPGVSEVKLVVYDLLGREVKVLVNERKQAGTHEVSFDGSGLASGIYIYRMMAGSFVQSRRMVLLK